MAARIPGTDVVLPYPTYLHLVTVGWLTNLIFGVAFWMFPRYTAESPRGSDALGWASYAGLNAGLLLRLIGEPAQLAGAGGRTLLLRVGGAAARRRLGLRAQPLAPGQGEVGCPSSACSWCAPPSAGSPRASAMGALLLSAKAAPLPAGVFRLFHAHSEAVLVGLDGAVRDGRGMVDPAQVPAPAGARARPPRYGRRGCC